MEFVYVWIVEDQELL